jgi:hypothetical protein
MNNVSDIKQLLLIIEQQLDWGEASDWQSKDFEMLNQLIFEKTKVSLSASTLRRIWGRVEYNHLPSSTTLDTLARFAGFESWRTFSRQKPVAVSEIKEVQQTAPSPKKKPRWLLKAALVIASAVTISLLGIYAKKAATPPKGPFLFNTKPVTRSIPNSVIFTYDVKTKPGDSVFIQQSWDPDTRVSVDKNLHQVTSIYYRPGFYHAKLGVNNKVVKEQLLLIPTTGWLGLIAQQPIPVYLNSNEFISKYGMQVPVSVITQKNIKLSPQPPAVEYYNVGNFSPIPLKDFSFSTQVKNDYHEGAAACQFLEIILFTDNTPVIIQLSAKGCVSELRLLNGGYFISGKDHDLSGFGTDLSQWVKVSCHSIPGKIQYFVNDKLIYESPRPLYDENIVGIGYRFQGTGSVKNVSLKQSDKTVFQAF